MNLHLKQMRSLFWYLATFTSTSKVTCCSFQRSLGAGDDTGWLLAFPTKVSGFVLCGLLGSATSTASHPSKNHFIVVSVGVLRGN